MWNCKSHERIVLCPGRYSQGTEAFEWMPVFQSKALMCVLRRLTLHFRWSRITKGWRSTTRNITSAAFQISTSTVDSSNSVGNVSGIWKGFDVVYIILTSNLKYHSDFKYMNPQNHFSANENNKSCCKIQCVQKVTQPIPDTFYL